MTPQPPIDPKLMEKAKEICDYHRKNTQIDWSLVQKQITWLAQQHGDEQRNAGLEEAAKVAETEVDPTSVKSDWYGNIAKAIRSLKRTV